MDPLSDTHKPILHELRILVLHNQDFSVSPEEDVPFDLLSRADVLHVAQDIGRALAARGHFVEIQAVDRDDLPNLYNRLKADPPDLVFNLCESLGGDDRNEIVLPALLDLLKIPYTGSGPMALGITLRKEYTQSLLKSLGISVPNYAILGALAGSPEQDLQVVQKQGLHFPLMVKPTRENASVGIDENSVVFDNKALLLQIDRLRRQYNQPILIEQYIEGKEINVSLLGNHPPQVLPLHEMDFSQMPDGYLPIISYSGKWNKASPEYLGSTSKLATDLPPVLLQKVYRAAISVFQALELADYARCDFRVSQEGEPYLIDVNANCDLAKDAGFTKAAAQANLTYEQMIEQIAFFALSRSYPSADTKSKFIHPHNVSFFDSPRPSTGSEKNSNAALQEFALHQGRDLLRLRVGEQRPV